MGIKSTVDITRQQAIDRIREIGRFVIDKDYQAVDKETFEPDHCVSTFVDTNSGLDLTGIEKWSDKMLEDRMDQPFFRYSMFDNYLIREES